MPEGRLHSPPSNEVLRQLQETLLKAVLMRQTLPGGRHPIMIPDLPFLLRQSSVVLIDEHLAGPLSIEESPMPIRILSREALIEEAHTQGDITYLHFHPSEFKDDAAMLTLEVSIAPRDPEQRALGLGGVRVRFQKVADQWEVLDEPTYFAV